jgi:hypothetical protein
MRQPLDHLRPPALAGLPRQNVAPDLPVEQHQFAVDGQRRALLGSVDAGFQVKQPVGVKACRSSFVIEPNVVPSLFRRSKTVLKYCIT